MSSEQDLGELIGTMKTFIDAQKECNSRLEESIDKLALAMVKAVADLTEKIKEASDEVAVAKDLAAKAHGKIATLYKVVSALGAVIGGAVGTFMWLLDYGRQAVQAAEKIMGH